MTQKKDNIQQEMLKGHRDCSKLINDDYGTIAFFIPKSDLQKTIKKELPYYSNKELRFNCIYFLIGYEINNKNESIEKMYVGQAGIRNNGESVLRRLTEHVTNTEESYYNKWDYIVVVTNEKDAWGSTELDALEYLFWSFIPSGNRYNSQLPASNGANLQLFTDSANQIKAYLNKLQFSMFSRDTDEKTANQVERIAEAKSDIPIDLNDGTTCIPDITTPSKVVNEMINMLPRKLFDDPDTVFLDPACKRGEYLKAIYKKCKASEKHKSYFLDASNPDLAQSIHIINKQLYGVALTPNSLKLAISGDLSGTNNIKMIPNYIDDIKAKKSLIGILKKEFNKDMKIDVVIGNPPYNDDETKKATAVYSDFVLRAKDFADYIAFITPARWYSGGRGKSLNDLRKTLLTENHLKTLVDYPNSKEVFKNNVMINGGVCYYLYDKGYTGTCNVRQIRNDEEVYQVDRYLSKYPIFIRDAFALSIIEKVVDKNKGNYFLNEIGVQAVDCFNVKDNVAVHGYYREGDIKIVDSSGYLYAKRDYLNNVHLIDCYNVLVTHAIGGEGYVIPNTTQILNKGEACSVSYLCVGGTQEVEKAERLLKYIRSKFVRFLILQTISGQNISASNFMFVPMQKFDSTDGIDWSQSIENIDQQLYTKYGLSKQEITYIERTIKPMSNILSTNTNNSKTVMKNEEELIKSPAEPTTPSYDKNTMASTNEDSVHEKIVALHKNGLLTQTPNDF